MPQTHREHGYRIQVTWTGNTGTGTSGYRDYTRDHEVEVEGKPEVLLGSADKTFRGDPARWNPEELLVSALSQCHMLAYLHLCTVNDVVVLAYVDRAEGTMQTDASGSGHFTDVTLRPEVTISAESDPQVAQKLHADAHAACFIANSVNFPVEHAPRIVHG